MGVLAWTQPLRCESALGRAYSRRVGVASGALEHALLLDRVYKRWCAKTLTLSLN